MDSKKSVNGNGKEINEKVVDRLINELAYGLNQRRMNEEAREINLSRSPIRVAFESSKV